MLEAVIEKNRVVGARGEGDLLIVPDGTEEIAHGALRERREIHTVILPQTCRRIGQHAFLRCTNLESIHFPDSLEEIGTKAFSGCAALREIAVPDGCRLGEKPFFSCTGLEEITLGRPENGVAKDLFFGCTHVKALRVPDEMLRLDDMPGSEGLSPAVRAYLGIPDEHGFLVRDHQLIAYFGEAQEMVIPGHVREIAPRVFKNNSTVRKVDFPDHLQRIGWNAFDSCSALESIFLPPRMEKIESEAFRQCFSLECVSIPSSCHMGRDVFYGCRNIRRFDVADGGSVGADFYGIPTKDGFLIRDGELINYWGPTGSIRVPEGVKRIARGAFNHAFMSFRPLTDHAHITLPSTLEEMQFMRILRGSQISVSLPEGFLTQQRQLDPDLGEWLATKWSHVLTLREMTALYLFQDHTRWPFQLEDEIRRHVPQAALHMLDLLEGKRLKEQTAKNLASFLRRWENRIPPAAAQRLRMMLKEETSPSPHEMPAISPALPDLGGDRLRIPPAAPGPENSRRKDTRLSEFALLYLSGAGIPAILFARTVSHFETVAAVWKQGGRYFTRADGAFLTEGGTPLILSGDPVTAAHSLEMPEDIMRKWRRFFAGRGMESLLGQLEEPTYDLRDFREETFAGSRIKIGTLRELPWWDGLHLYDYRGNNLVLETDAGAALAVGWELQNLPYGTLATRDDHIVLGSLHSRGSSFNRRANRILYTLDRLTYKSRLDADDPSLQPFLASLPPKKAAPLIRRAAQKGAAKLSAVLLEGQKDFHDGLPADHLTLD